MKEWKFVSYSGVFVFGSGVCLGLSGQNGGFDFYQTTQESQLQYTSLFILLAVVASLLPLAASRYEVARAQVH